MTHEELLDIDELMQGGDNHARQLRAHALWSAAKLVRGQGHRELADRLKAAGNRLVWTTAGMTPDGGCLCIACLERQRRSSAVCCVDCSRNTYDEWYRVHDALWTMAGMTPDGGCLCIECLERRLGRQLNRTDFTNANDLDGSHSARLRDRLAAGDNDSQDCRSSAIDDGRAIVTEEDRLHDMVKQWSRDSTPHEIFPEMAQCMVELIEWIEDGNNYDAVIHLENIQALADAISNLTECRKKCLSRGAITGGSRSSAEAVTNVVEISCRLQDERAIATKEARRQRNYEQLDDFIQDWSVDSTPHEIFSAMTRCMVEWVEATNGISTEIDSENVETLAHAIGILTRGLNNVP